MDAMKLHRMVLGGMAAMVLMFLPMKMNAQRPDIDVRLSIGAHRGYSANRLYVSLGREYNVPYREVYSIHEAGIPDDDIPVILYIHERSPYSIQHIYGLRLHGASWDQLSTWCRVPLYKDGHRHGPPHGNAYGYYRHGRGSGHHDGDRNFGDRR